MKDTTDAYKLARRANLAAAERGEFKTAELTRAAEDLPPSELYERPKGIRKFIFGIRRRKTVNSRLRELV